MRSNFPTSDEIVSELNGSGLWREKIDKKA